MATITATDMSSGQATVTKTTLGASDTFTYDSTKRPVLILDNVTGGALTVTIDGDGASTVSVSGVGAVDISGGYSTGSIAAGAQVVIPLKDISAYLSGTIAVTGGTGIEAALLEY
ncbi:hypothetical protein ACFVYJ_01535 [Pontibacter sp. JAM-7]|uniref:hypothetical protein n=1 Tax=Pontibacter sp. JAM-7 TaxID=3366581 RepID=UPI003AF65E9E